MCTRAQTHTHRDTCTGVLGGRAKFQEVFNEVILNGKYIQEIHWVLKFRLCLLSEQCCLADQFDPEVEV